MTKNDKSFFKTIAVNKKARHDYFIEETFEAGIVLEGWEVKVFVLAKSNLWIATLSLKMAKLGFWGLILPH